MQQFVIFIVQFVRDVFSSISYAISLITSWDFSAYESFLAKNIFLNNSLLGLNLTFGELFKYVFIWVLLLTILILFVKFICKIFTIFRV